MQTIDVSDLPEPLIRALEEVIQTLRQKAAPAVPKETEHELPIWEGQVIGKLTREEIYDNGV